MAVDCASFQESTEEYLLGLLPDGEQAALRQHVENCRECHELAESYEASWLALGLAVPQHAPPPSLRERVLAAVAEDRREAHAAEPVPLFTKRERQPQTRRRQWAWPLVTAASLLIAIGSLAWGFSAQQQLAARQEDLARVRAELAAAGSLASSERVVAWSLTPTEVAPQAKGRIVMDDSGSGVVFVSDMPQPKAGMAYQLWLVDDDERSSAGVFVVDQNGRGYLVFDSPKPGRRFTSCGITMEPAEGSPAPTTPRIIGGSLFRSPSST